MLWRRIFGRRALSWRDRSARFCFAQENVESRQLGLVSPTASQFDQGFGLTGPPPIIVLASLGPVWLGG
jgi:hypothetical protein